jgi:transposase-like protein
VSFFDSRHDSAASSSTLVPNIPATCPTCRSSSITTTAKNPNTDSYWRCRNCGEIWNNARRRTAGSGVNTWR